MVIGDRPLVELVPLYRDPKTDGLVTQFNMKYVEQAGLVKFDFLGLTTLTILERALAFLRETGIEVDLARIALDDAKTYAMLGRGDTAGVFQFEGAGMRDVLRQMRPDRLEDLTAAVALYRPGPMANIPEYCARKHGAAWAAPHPDLEEILRETYGIMVYQEQVMQIAQTMAGYSLGSADLLRRAMGKKIRSEMDKQREVFTAGAVGRGVAQSKAVEVFDLMAKFADYGFNKSHAAAYALLSYQTAWLKANHPTAFLAACMSLAINNTDKLAALRQEVGRLGIALLPPDINRSGADFRVERTEGGADAIRYALAAVKRVGLSAMQALCASRGERPFGDVGDFALRVDPGPLNRMQLESLVRAGAFDGLEPNRARLMAGVETVLKRAQSNSEAAASGQIGLFGGGEPEPLRLVDVPAWSDLERLGHEADAIGFHLTAHPLDAYGAVLGRLGTGGDQRRRGRGGGGGRAGAHRGMRGGPQGTADAHRWQDGLAALVGRDRHHGGDAVLGGAVAASRPARGGTGRAGDGRPALRGRGVADHGGRGARSGAGRGRRGGRSAESVDRPAGRTRADPVGARPGRHWARAGDPGAAGERRARGRDRTARPVCGHAAPCPGHEELAGGGAGRAGLRFPVDQTPPELVSGRRMSDIAPGDASGRR